MKTKNFISLMSLTIGVFVSVIAITACGSSDDDSIGGNGSDKQSPKHISLIIEEEGNSIYESTLSYDSQGRVVKVVGTESSVGTNSRSEKTYQYGETIIVTKEVEEGTWSNGQSFTYTESHSYQLENGRIIKDEERQGSSSMTATYNYNADGYLTSIDESGSNNSNNTEIVTWKNGNISSMGSYTYTYSNIPWAKGFSFYLKGSNLDGYLFSMGYYGNLPKNLPSSISDGWTFDYTVQDGYVTKAITTPAIEDNKHHKLTTTFIWE